MGGSNGYFTGVGLPVPSGAPASKGLERAAVVGGEKVRSATPKSRASSVAPLAEKKDHIEGMPPLVIPIQRGFNCIAIVVIGGVKFRVVFDTGAARSLIRTSFARQLRQNRRTKGSTFGP